MMTQEAAPRGITPEDSQSFPKLSRRQSSKTIPISGALHRSESELQLQESERMAEHRDYCMFTRIVQGMSSRSSFNDSWQSNDSLLNVIRTRHAPIQVDDTLEQLSDNRDDKYPYKAVKDAPSSSNLPPEWFVDDGAADQNMMETPSDEGIFDMEL